MKYFYFLIVFSWSLSLAALEIKTSADFSKYTQQHIQRVQRLGRELTEKFPEHFKNLNLKMVQKFLSLHDQAKLKPEVLKSLSEYYGRSLDSLTEAESKKFLELKRMLNQKDFEIRMNFLKEHGFVDARGKVSVQGRKLFYIEKIADLVDRGSSLGSAHEFGRPMSPASSLLRSPTSTKMAQALEAVYPKVVEGIKHENVFTQFGWKSLKTAGKVVSSLGKLLSAPLAIFGELASPSESIADDDEEFKIFYRKHPEFIPHEATTSKAVK